MARISKPWFRAQTQTWCAIVGGKQYTLAEGKRNKQAAAKALAEVIANQGKVKVPGKDCPVKGLVDCYLEEYVEHECSPHSFESYKRYLDFFMQAVGETTPTQKVTPALIKAWLKTREWSQSTRAGFITVVKGMFIWAVAENLIPGNPLTSLKAPSMERREVALDQETVGKILAEVADDFSFGDLVRFLHATGCRPSEAMTLAAAHVDLGNSIATKPGKTTRKTGRMRTLYLNPVALEIVRRRAADWPGGPIFRNSHGGAWSRFTIAHRFQRLRDKLGLGPEIMAESFRHTYITQALLSGESDSHVAEIVGHASTRTISKHYSHLGNHGRAMLAIANRIASRTCMASHQDGQSNGAPES
jgi:integrase